MNETEREFSRQIAQHVASLRMAVPAIFLLESSRPLSRTGGQLLIFFAPIAQAFFAAGAVYRLAALLDTPDGIEQLLCDIEAAEDQRLRAVHERGAA